MIFGGVPIAVFIPPKIHANANGIKNLDECQPIFWQIFNVIGRSIASAPILLIKEDKSYEPYKQIIESAVVTYLKQTDQYDNLLNEEGEVPTFEPEQDVFCNCFGIDVYEIDDKLISEKEYAKTL